MPQDIPKTLLNSQTTQLDYERVIKDGLNG